MISLDKSPSSLQALGGVFNLARSQHLHFQSPVMFSCLQALWVRGFLSCSPSSSVFAWELLLWELAREDEGQGCSLRPGSDQCYSWAWRWNVSSMAVILHAQGLGLDEDGHLIYGANWVTIESKKDTINNCHWEAQSSYWNGVRHLELCLSLGPLIKGDPTAPLLMVQESSILRRVTL